MMSWQITQGSTTVTLPYAPQTNTDESPTIDDSSINIPEEGTTLVSVCNDVRTLTMEGFFYIAGSTKALSTLPILFLCSACFIY